MKYSNQLELLSTAIFGLNEAPPAELAELVTPNAVHQLRIYRKNLFFGAHQNLSDVFVGIYQHLGKENFRFIARKYLIEECISSPDIHDFVRSFPTYLHSIVTFHEDPLLPHLADLDLLHTYVHLTLQQCPKGIFAYWSELIISHDTTTPEIDFEQLETIQVIHAQSEHYLQLALDT